MKLPYVLIVEDEKHVEEAKAYLRGECGRGRLRSVSGKSTNVRREMAVAVTIVVAPLWYRSILGARKSSRSKTRNTKTVCFKFPRELAEMLYTAAAREGTTLSELVRRAIVAYFIALSTDDRA